jgi:putative Mg2+ transporter-C (MgtC) family protein
VSVPHLDLPGFAGNVALALALGILIGLERQWRQHPAGLRTTALVAIGATLFVSLSRLVPGDASPTRIAAYVVSGIGFLGGGVIIKEGANVRGVTTAATLWCSAAVGTLAGLGFGLHAAIGTAVVLLVVMGLRPVSKGLDILRVRSEGVPGEYRVRVAYDTRNDGAVRESLTEHVTSQPGLALTALTVKKKKGRKRVVLIADLRAEPANDAAVQDLVTQLLRKRGVTAANWEKIAPVVE